MIKYLLYAMVASVVIIQFFQIDKTSLPSEERKDFIALNHPPVEVEEILRSACYDCHSNHTEYPWYSNIQPVGWWLADHVDHGRGHLNFSDWGNYEEKKQKHKVTECMEEVEEGEMPLNSYTWMHGDARLTEEQRETLIAWFNTLPHEEDH